MTGATRADLGTDVPAYAAQVRRALSDVPADRLAELLEDLDEHLAEVAAESGETLVDRLGPPAEYAAELRAAAGLEPVETVDAPVGRRHRIAELVPRARASKPAQEVIAFLPELRPAWWVARPWLAMLAIDRAFLGRSTFPIPTLGFGWFIGLILTGAAITFSVRWGRRALADPPAHHRPLLMAGNAALGILALAAVIGVASPPQPAQADPYYEDQVGSVTLTHEDGTPITNIFPYSPDGELLDGVLLYDQDGRPVDNLSTYTTDGLPVEPAPVTGAPQPGNAYPQEQQLYVYDEYGMQVPAPVESSSPAVPTTAAPATPSAPLEPTPEPTLEPTPVPTATP